MISPPPAHLQPKQRCRVSRGRLSLLKVLCNIYRMYLHPHIINLRPYVIIPTHAKGEPTTLLRHANQQRLE